jgi:hypothetical protein
VIAKGRAKSIPNLVTELYEIRRQVAELKERDRELSDCLVTHGPGELKGLRGIIAQVRFPTAKISTPPDDKADFLSRKLGEPKFNKLFEPRWHPIKDFRAVLSAICSNREQQAVLEIVEIESRPYVCFP